MTDPVYIGVNDRALELFEGKYAVPNGMACSSCVVTDREIACRQSTVV